MTLRIPITQKTIFAAFLLGLLLCGAAMAEERKFYKYVDGKGNIAYSQSPPMTGTDVKMLDTHPAYRGKGGYSMSGSPYDDPRVYSQDYRQELQQKALQQRQRQMEDARLKRFAELEAECNRNRGTDCNDPEALRYIESTKIPHRYPRY
jgi:hypothetical protein